MDINTLVEIDRLSYGDYGADLDYFKKRLQEFPTGVLVVENEEKITGFAVFEKLTKDQIPEHFSDLKTSQKISEPWIHIIAFTTETNYKDVESDTKLLLKIEEIAGKHDCKFSCVPLTKDHPFKGNGVFAFWEKNGYKIVGSIKWQADSGELLDCHFYLKEFKPTRKL